MRFRATVHGSTPAEIEAEAVRVCAEFFGDIPHRIEGDYEVDRTATITGRTVGYTCDIIAASDDDCMNPECTRPGEVILRVFDHPVGMACLTCSHNVPWMDRTHVG